MLLCLTVHIHMVTGLNSQQGLLFFTQISYFFRCYKNFNDIFFFISKIFIIQYRRVVAQSKATRMRCTKPSDSGSAPRTVVGAPAAARPIEHRTEKDRTAFERAVTVSVTAHIAGRQDFSVRASPRQGADPMRGQVAVGCAFMPSGCLRGRARRRANSWWR